MEKENEEVEAAEQAEKKKSSKKTSGSRATDSSGGGAGTSTKVRALAPHACFHGFTHMGFTVIAVQAWKLLPKHLVVLKQDSYCMQVYMLSYVPLQYWKYISLIK